MAKSKLHESITPDRIVELVEQDNNYGLCLICGEEAHPVEPDAAKYECESCGRRAVFGVEYLLIYLAA